MLIWNMYYVGVDRKVLEFTSTIHTYLQTLMVQVKSKPLDNVW